MSPLSKRAVMDRVAIGALLGIVMISIGGAALLAAYFERLGHAVDGAARTDPLPAYSGRPSAVGMNGVQAVNYLLMTTRGGRLDAVVIAHLSSSRRDLTLVALPSNLLADGGSGQATLASSYLHDPLETAKAVESLTLARMDHQVRFDLTGLPRVVDSLGGVPVGGDLASGTEVAAYLASAPDEAVHSARTADLFRSSFARVGLGSTITDPNRFSKVMDAVTACVTVDAELTGDEIREVLVELRVKSDTVRTWPLASNRGTNGAEADAVALETLRSALATDEFPTLVPTQSGQTVPHSGKPTDNSGASSPNLPPSQTTSTNSAPDPGKDQGHDPASSPGQSSVANPHASTAPPSADPAGQPSSPANASQPSAR